MPNIGKVLKDEIQRISDKSSRATAAKLRKEIAALRAAQVSLRKEVGQLKKQQRAGVSTLSTPSTSPDASASRKGRRGGITSKGIVSLRKRLGLTQTAFAELAEVTPQSVTLWENKDGPLRLRTATAAKLDELKGIGKREAQQRLAAAKKSPPRPRKKAARKARKKKA